MLQEHMENREWLVPHDSGTQFGDFGDLSALTLSDPHLLNKYQPAIPSFSVAFRQCLSCVSRTREEPREELRCASALAI